MALLAGALPCVAAAQDAPADADPAAQARALFTEGVELAGQHQYADAAVRFRQALALRDAPAIRYNLASTLFEEHQYTEAHEIAQSLLATPDLPESVRTPTEALELQIGAAAALVTFDLPEGVLGDVQVDGTPIADPTRSTALAPGRHEARAVSNGQTVAIATFEVGSGVRREVELTPGAGDTATEPAGPEGPITDQWWFWAAVGGGVVVLGVIVGVAVGVADHDAHQPIAGNFSPGIISW